jgi:hypothetical protein
MEKPRGKTLIYECLKAFGIAGFCIVFFFSLFFRWGCFA